MKKTLFSPQDFDKIQQAVKEAELNISGEIVPVIVDKSDSYDSAWWQGFATFGMFGLFLAFILDYFFEIWVNGVLFSIVSFFSLSGIFIILSFLFPKILKLFLNKNEIDSAIHAKTQMVFLQNNVFATQKRSGILIFLSLFEKRIEILADEGINQKVEAVVWQNLVKKLSQGIQQNNATVTLISIIEECAKILQENGFTTNGSNPNELADHVRID